MTSTTAPDALPGRRAQQAERTRAEILAAARRLFAERGYARTTVRDVAQAAGVSTQTVYDSVGSKQALVLRLNDLIDAEADVAGTVGAALASGDPATIAATSAAVTRSILEHCGDVLRTLAGGATAEPDLAAVVAEGHRRHVAGARGMATALQEAGALSIDVEQATATMAALADPWFALLLADTYGWSLDRIEGWVADTTRTSILASPRPRRRRA